MFGSRKRLRKRLEGETPPESWTPILEKNVPYFELLDESEQRQLLAEMLFFLADKDFEGCGGFEITEEVRVSIAAQACLLLLNREHDCYGDLKSILVYPHPYATEVERQLPDGTVVVGNEGRQGESWHRGVLILAWDAVKSGAVDTHDGHNVVMHEFAHQLDQEAGGGDGAPRLETRGDYRRWARIMNNEYEHLLEVVEQNHKTVMDRYGATNPAEFFAVATEAFFEKPRQMKKHHPELYDLLAAFYHQDPVLRFQKS